MNAPFRGLAAIEVVGAGRRVPLLDGSTVPYVNLDNAASTPALRPVADAVTGFLDSPYRIVVGPWGLWATVKEPFARSIELVTCLTAPFECLLGSIK